ncbi:hypothetical protein ACE7GA_14590 [Roseomonas sp. CCTCC AB2023176]|uniref:hypothetical protein n=1 Tax=Roseomonas sp. CCTCC AB2023176 TaxID=3342640 RepID=UPI0035DEFDBA
MSLAPWQQDYVALSVIAAARHGQADARAFLAWMTNFLVGRFEVEARGFLRRDGVAYQIAAGRGGQAIDPNRTWREIGAAMRAAGTSNDDGWTKSRGDYGALALASLSGIADALNHDGARRAHAWLRDADPPFTSRVARQRDPTLNIVPRRADGAGCAIRSAARRG